MAPSDPDHDDETLVRNQPALRRSRGNEWLVIGAIIAAATISVLLLTDTAPGTVGAVMNGALYLAMVVVRFAAPLQRPRLWTLAFLLGTTAAVALVAILLAIATV